MSIASIGFELDGNYFQLPKRTQGGMIEIWNETTAPIFIQIGGEDPTNINDFDAKGIPAGGSWWSFIDVSVCPINIKGTGRILVIGNWEK